MARRTSKPRPPTGRRARAGRTSESAYDAGIRLLARRAHSRAELRRKLSRRGFELDDVDGAVARLTERGYLDDATFAAGHVRRRSVTLGPLALSAELSARGVDRRVADAALEGFDRPAQVAAATALAGRLAARRRPPGYRELLDSVGAKLLRRGFSITVAQEACRAVWLGTPSTAES